METKQALMDLINEQQLINWRAKGVLVSLQANGDDSKTGFSIGTDDVLASISAVEGYIDQAEQVTIKLLSLCRRITANDE